MAFWHIEFSKQAYKTYKKLAKGYQKKIDSILYLLINKERIDIKPVAGEEDIYRVRVGKYRMLIKVYKKERIILVVKIGPRGDIYKK
ncbi:plasmid stabilization system [Thermodesulfatator indicus DSM 15286]|uniref:Plasmid stabilization system n=1 Tax=Thermodesulfatator indicus (strain DSM 15286 / JCM 11887 / CIR29812) TaxID=667014 RepID=F8AC30_THEID|nr:type II toxin-antitoxin system RelE/ParE family toxin [Thermodesulfatator indicus]AEH44585.1 plasmid stabilization system [Thermodesulfatator indicus DSM 15286]